LRGWTQSDWEDLLPYGGLARLARHARFARQGQKGKEAAHSFGAEKVGVLVDRRGPDCTKARRLEETKTARKSTSRTTNNKKIWLIDMYDGDDEDDEDDDGVCKTRRERQFGKSD